MEMGSVAALVVLLTLASVLAVSGLAKARDPRATRDAFDALRVPTFVPADLAAQLLPWMELALAAALLVLPAPWLVPAAVGALVLMLLYAGLIGRALSFDDPVSCSCFGSIGSHEVDRLTLSRNVLLVLLSAAAVWFATDGGSAPASLARLDAAGWWALVATTSAAAVAVLVVGVRTSSTPPAPSVDVEVIDYERLPIPFGVVSFADDTTATLAELAGKQARMVFILNYHCGSCVRIGDRLDEWAESLAPAVDVLAVYPGREKLATVQTHSVDLAAWEPELNVRRLFDVSAPAAVLLGADGLMAGGPVKGEDEIEEFVEDVLRELAGPSAAHA